MKIQGKFTDLKIFDKLLVYKLICSGRRRCRCLVLKIRSFRNSFRWLARVGLSSMCAGMLEFDFFRSKRSVHRSVCTKVAGYFVTEARPSPPPEAVCPTLDKVSMISAARACKSCRLVAVAPAIAASRRVRPSCPRCDWRRPSTHARGYGRDDKRENVGWRRRCFIAQRDCRPNGWRSSSWNGAAAAAGVGGVDNDDDNDDASYNSCSMPSCSSRRSIRSAASWLAPALLLLMLR